MKSRFKKLLSGMLIASAVNISAANPIVDIRDIIDESQPDAKDINTSDGLNKKLQKIHH